MKDDQPRRQSHPHHGQLIDAANGAHLWAERYDRELTSIFEVQDEVTYRIVEALEVTLRPAERALVGDGRASNVEAHDWFLRGRELMLSPNLSRGVYSRAAAAFRRAIELDPSYAQPHAGLAMAHCLDFQNHWSDTPDALDFAEHFAAQGVDKGPNEPLAHFAAAVIAVWKRDLAKAKVDAGRALELNPNYALAYGTLGQVEVYLGHPLEALPFIERAIRLDPAFSQQYTHFLGSAYFGAGQYEKAARTFREQIRLSPRTDVSRVFLAFALGHLGEMQEAHAFGANWWS